MSNHIPWNESAWIIRQHQVWVFKKEQKANGPGGSEFKYDEYAIVVYKFHPWFGEKRDLVANQVLGPGFKFSDNLPQLNLPPICVTGKKSLVDAQDFDVFSFVIHDFLPEEVESHVIEPIRLASDYAISKSKDNSQITPKLEGAESETSLPRDMDRAAYDASEIFFQQYPDVTIINDKYLKVVDNNNDDEKYVFLSPGDDKTYKEITPPANQLTCSIHTTHIPVYSSSTLADLENLVQPNTNWKFKTDDHDRSKLLFRSRVAVSIAARFLSENIGEDESPANGTSSRKQLADDCTKCEDYWKNDRVHKSGSYNFYVGDIAKVMRTIASIPESDARNYLDFLKQKDFMTSLSERGQNLTAWENTFRSIGFPPDRIKLLMELWIDLTMRQVDEWINVGLKWKEGTSMRQIDLFHEERNMRSHMFEMLDFSDKLATYNPSLKGVARDLRLDVERKVKTVEVEKNLSVRSKMYTLNTVWANVGNELDEEYVRDITHFYNFQQGAVVRGPNDETNVLQLLQERSMQLSRLRDIQRMVEKVLDYDNYDKTSKMTDTKNPLEMIGRMDVKNVRLHKYQPLHLFTTNTYLKLKEKILDFMKETQDMKEGHVYLLRLRFEQAALQEVVRRLYEMIDDVKELGQLIKHEYASNDMPAFFDRGLGLLENLEWECTRTWQQEFEVDQDVERRRWDAVIAYADKKDEDVNSLWQNIKDGPTKSLQNLEVYMSKPVKVYPKADAFIASTKRIGGNAQNAPPPNMPASFFDAESSTDGLNERSAIQSSIDHWKSAARRLFVNLRAAIANSTFNTIPGNNSLIALFLEAEVTPRLAAFSDAVNGAMRVYLKPSSIDPSENLAVKRAEKRQKEIARSGYRITVADGIRYRTTDPAMHLLVGLKLIRFVGQIAASWAARRSYSDEFTKAVLVNGQAPPPLTKMLFIFLGIDATIQLFTLMGLVISSYLLLDRREASSALYVIDDDFIQAFLVDYFITTIAIGILAYIIASLMRKKSYFRLSEDGERTASAYGWALVGISGVVAVIPPLSL